MLNFYYQMFDLKENEDSIGLCKNSCKWKSMSKRRIYEV